MPVVGLEPTRGCPQQILSLPRLPFRHAGFYGTFKQSRVYFTFDSLSIHFCNKSIY